MSDVVVSPNLGLRTVYHNLQPLVLASESPRRSQMLRSVGLDFTIVASGVEEEEVPDREPVSLAAGFAEDKARAVADRRPQSWVLSADTIVALRGRVFGKPANADEARSMLQQLSDQEHEVFSGVCLMRGDPPFLQVGVVQTEVRFRRLSNAEILAYVETGEPFDKAGGYGIQGIGAFLVKSIRGSYTNVVGLPLGETLEWLLEQGIIAPGRP